MDDSEKQRFEELLPWFVNGTLGTQERAWVEQYLRAHPEQRAQLTWLKSLQERIREAVPAFDSERGLDRLLQRVRSERHATAARSTAPPFPARIREWVASFQFRGAFAGAALLILGQATVIGVLFQKQRELESEYAVERSLAVSAGSTARLLKVSFKPDARENDIRLLLLQVGGTMAGGPGQLGEWVIKVPVDRVTDAEARLRESGFVDAVEIESPPSDK